MGNYGIDSQCLRYELDPKVSGDSVAVDIPDCDKIPQMNGLELADHMHEKARVVEPRVV